VAKTKRNGAAGQRLPSAEQPLPTDPLENVHWQRRDRRPGGQKLPT
jgi:hypothetical protein